jgi:hypothetical protein
VDDDLFAQGPAPVARQPVERPVERQVEADPFIAAAPAPRAIPLRADNDPVIGGQRDDRAAREALFRDMLDGNAESAPAYRDPFEHGRFAHERRVMMAAVMGGRR